MEMVKKKIQTLQLQVDEAEERELAVQRVLDTERELREKVRHPVISPTSFSFLLSHSPVLLTLPLSIVCWCGLLGT